MVPVTCGLDFYSLASMSLGSGDRCSPHSVFSEIFIRLPGAMSNVWVTESVHGVLFYYQRAE